MAMHLAAYTIIGSNFLQGNLTTRTRMLHVCISFVAARKILHQVAGVTLLLAEAGAPPSPLGSRDLGFVAKPPRAPCLCPAFPYILGAAPAGLSHLRPAIAESRAGVGVAL